MSNGTGMKVITGISLALAIAACVGTFVEYNTATALTAQLATATTESQKLREQLSTATASADAKMAADQQ